MKESLTTNILIFIFALGMMFTSCKKEDTVPQTSVCVSTDSTTCVFYPETQCADPWGYGFSNDAELIQRIDIYLDSLNIDLDEIHLGTMSPAEDCLACVCTSGRSICGLVDNEDLDAIKALGFTEE